MPESVYDKKARVRPPRVHITYEVETGGAMVMKEIPFVMGILADLSGQPAERLPKLAERKFVEIDRDNFDDVLASVKPRVAMRVENTLAEDGTEIAIDLDFAKLADFSPESVVQRIKPLAELQDVRNKLKDLLGRMEGNHRLEELLDVIAQDEGVRGKLKDTLGAASGNGGNGGNGSNGPAGEEA